jgi:hypothetical protein
VQLPKIGDPYLTHDRLAKVDATVVRCIGPRPPLHIGAAARRSSIALPALAEPAAEHARRKGQQAANDQVEDSQLPRDYEGDEYSDQGRDARLQYGASRDLRPTMKPPIKKEC